MITTHNKYAVGVFTSRKAVEESVNELKASSFPIEKVAIFARHTDRINRIGEVQVSSRIDNHNVDTTGSVGDTLSAGFWGSVLVGLSSLVLPGGIGVIIAVGSIGAAFVISVAGVAVSAIATNHLIKVLAGLGIPEDRARHYCDRIQCCEYLFVLKGKDEEIQSAEPILREHEIQYWGIYEPPQSVNKLINI
nr:hypothetical protein [Dendronalium sp. ChiSLP03b]MDZ8208696.1 hypothetical protein [Dendronalium sp. ChiSLP03b]